MPPYEVDWDDQDYFEDPLEMDDLDFDEEDNDDWSAFEDVEI